MSTSWKNWCKLCGSVEATTKIENSTEIEEIQGFLKYLALSITKIKVCQECMGFLNEINNFIVKSKTVEHMFVELLNVDDSSQNSLNEIRARFGLEKIPFSEPEYVLEDDNDEFFDDVYDEPAVIIKQEKEDEELVMKVEDEEYELTEMDEKTGEIITRTKTPTSIKNSDQDQSDSDDLNESVSEQGSKSKIRQEHKDNKKRKGGNAEEKTDEEKLFDFTCHVCRKEFVKMRHLMTHCKEEHSCLAQVNCVCGKVLATWNRLLVHKRKHFPDKPNYECKECKLTYYKQSTYDAHINSKHGPDAKKFICAQCGKSFKAGNILRTHERTHLPDELKSTEQCQICEKKFVNKNALNKHINSLHTREILFTCEQCGKSFTSKERNFPCEVCLMKFKSSADLRKHKRVHSEKSLECRVCGAKFKMRPTLLAHMVIHSDEKKYKCTYCPNEYKRPQALKCHLSVHTGERPYSCPFCDRTFINGSNCRKHKLKDHPIELAAYEAIHGKGKVA